MLGELSGVEAIEGALPFVDERDGHDTILEMSVLCAQVPRMAVLSVQCWHFPVRLRPSTALVTVSRAQATPRPALAEFAFRATTPKV
jgi:hypothetical protein